MPSANGLWTNAFNKPLRSEPCVVWQIRQFAPATFAEKCAFLNFSEPKSWQTAQGFPVYEVRKFEGEGASTHWRGFVFDPHRDFVLDFNHLNRIGAYSQPLLEVREYASPFINKDIPLMLNSISFGGY